jgi:hypothetical protein
MKRGDYICAFAGCTFPIILRRELEGNKYTGSIRCVEGLKEFIEELNGDFSLEEIYIH